MFFLFFFVCREEGVDAVEVAGEEGCFFDVGEVEQSGGKALQPRGRAAVRRHAYLKGLQIIREKLKK